MAGMMTRLRIVSTIQLLISKKFCLIDDHISNSKIAGMNFLFIYKEGTSIIGPSPVALVA